MKWIMLAGGIAFGLDWWLRDDILAGIFGMVFLFAAASLWKDDDDDVV